MISVTNAQLGALIFNLLTNPNSGEVDDQSAFEDLVTQLAELVCQFCGGEVVKPASYQPKVDLNWGTHYQVQVDPGEEGESEVWKQAAAQPSNSIDVKYWDAYDETRKSMTHTCTIDDRRARYGRVFVDFDRKGAEEKFAVSLEVHQNPLEPSQHVPCVHLHFDGDDLALSVFKLNANELLLRPEALISVDADVVVVPNWTLPETLYRVTRPVRA